MRIRISALRENKEQQITIKDAQINSKQYLLVSMVVRVYVVVKLLVFGVLFVT